MIKNMLMRLWVICLAVLALPLQAANPDVLDIARRITGHYDPESPIADILIKPWDPMSEEARKYIRFMNATPGRVFDTADDEKKCCSKEIESLEDLEDTVYDMHLNLEPRRQIKVSAGVSSDDLALWMAKINSAMLYYVRLHEFESSKYLVVGYNSDARVFAAFRNPDMESNLNDCERELLDVCAQWIVGNIEENMPNLLKIKKVHDALVDNCKYTFGYYDTYNMIVKGRGVCAAYTSSTRLLLHMLKINCRCVPSTPAMNHIWNLIEVNGDWYFTDVTWDDPLTPDGRDVKRFNYFLLTKAELEMSHEWEDEDNIYPETPQINKLGIFKRHDHREIKDDVKDDEELEYPRERESVLNTMLEMHREEMEKGLDKIQQPINPVASAVSSKSKPVEKNIKSLISSGFSKKKDKSEAAYKLINTLEDLYENLELCCEKLDGPTVTFELANTCGCFIQRLLMADYHLYVKYWNFRCDSKKKVLHLDIEHWPHVKLIRAYQDDALVKTKLSADEQKALAQCKKWSDIYGTLWKTDRQKLADLYEELIRSIEWTPGPSGVTSTLKERAGGSLGYAEALHVALTMLDIPSQLVHGRTSDSVRTWLVVRRANKKWYHVDAAGDALENNRHKNKFKYMLRCDDEMFDARVWDLREVPPTPIKDRERAAKQGLIKENESVPQLKPLRLF